jgi:hypothetical protein
MPVMTAQGPLSPSFFKGPEDSSYRPTTVTEKQPDQVGDPYFDPRKAAEAMMQSGDTQLMMAGYKMLSETDKTDATSQMKNYQFMNSLPPKDREAFQAMLTSNSGSLPAAVQEYNFYSQLDEAGKSEFLRVKRADMLINRGGSQAVRSPSGGIIEQYSVTPRPEDQPGFRAAQTRATETARADVTAGTESTKKGKVADSLISNIDQAENILKEGKATGSTIGAGVAAGKKVFGVSDASTQANRQLQLISGWMVANVPRMEGPQSNFDVQNYREMAATVGDATIPIDDRLAALQTLRSLQNKYKDIQGGGVEQAPAQRRASGSYQDPYTVTDDASYNAVPNGKYYKAPDGSIRQRK